MSKLNLKTLNEVIQDLVAYGTLDRQHPMTKILVRCIQTLHELPVPDYVAIGSIEIIGELVHVQTIDTDFNLGECTRSRSGCLKLCRSISACNTNSP
jgi:hypothetical protein